MHNQKHLFTLPADIHYLNGAYMSPLLKSAEEAGIQGLLRKRNPTSIPPADFFSGAVTVKEYFGKLVNGQPDHAAIISSASYGLMAAVNNLPIHAGQKAITVSNEFPSGYYALERWCRTYQKQIQVITPPEQNAQVGAAWNEALLNAIDDDTAVVLISSIHWTYGTIFDLKAIGEKCKQHGSYFIVDGTQSVGAMPIDVRECQIDALVCASYKWLMGPYSIGLAYYAPSFHSGIPLEESWMNRQNAQDFSSLTQYTEAYTPASGKFNMGESSNFIHLPMLTFGIKQILEWEPSKIQAYSEELTRPLLQFLNDRRLPIETDAFRAKHLFGLTIPATTDRVALAQKMQEEKVFVSMRGDTMRISTHLYNTDEDIDALVRCLEQLSV